MKIKDDNKLPALSKQIRTIAKKNVEVGIFGPEMSKIAGANEFGAKIPVSDAMRKFMAANGFPIKKTTKFLIIPQRSFIRSSFDNKEYVNSAFKFMKDIYDIDKNIDQALNLLGVKMADNIKKKIASNIQPENKPQTVKQKDGKNKTLIDTGMMLNSVKHKII